MKITNRYTLATAALCVLLIAGTASSQVTATKNDSYYFLSVKSRNLQEDHAAKLRDYLSTWQQYSRFLAIYKSIVGRLAAEADMTEAFRAAGSRDSLITFVVQSLNDDGIDTLIEALERPIKDDGTTSDAVSSLFTQHQALSGKFLPQDVDRYVRFFNRSPQLDEESKEFYEESIEAVLSEIEQRGTYEMAQLVNAAIAYSEALSGAGVTIPEKERIPQIESAEDFADYITDVVTSPSILSDILTAATALSHYDIESAVNDILNIFVTASAGQEVMTFEEIAAQLRTDGNTEDGNTEDGNTEDGNWEDGNWEDGNTEGPSTEDGTGVTSPWDLITDSEISDFFLFKPYMKLIEGDELTNVEWVIVIGFPLIVLVIVGSIFGCICGCIRCALCLCCCRGKA